MTALKILLAILLLFFLLGWIRVGGGVEYAQEGLLVRVRVGALWLQVFPIKREKKGKKSQKVKPKKEPEEPEAKKGGTLGMIKDLLPIACEAAGELKERIRIDKLLLDFVFGGSDPANTAMIFGYSNAAIGMLLPLFEHNFNVKERRVRTAMDFTAKEPIVYIYAAFSARIGQLVSFALRFGWKFLKIYLRNKNRQKVQKNAKKEAI
ncbi:DUF2953 domain-containing protein [Vermiculatibacterium agrestimuris]|uniref:DUF2953 domain-containing protein n=1 Tax=Vermiculatibacterium agrestimuris TaxID=2941519 RepID=UPI00203BCC58|nr:DUF2953 domain-containing protein [Vermiculatibacterium agrestimuris]